MRTSTVANGLASQLLHVRALCGALCDALDSALMLANALAEDAREREKASEAARQPETPERELPRVFGRKYDEDAPNTIEPARAPGAVGIVPIDNTPQTTG